MFRFLTGTVKYRIKSARTESLINRLRTTIPLYGISKPENNIIEFETGYRYRKNVDAAVADTSSQIIQIHSFGITALADRYRKRAGIWIGMMLSVIALFLSSSIIWEVRISGNSFVSDSDIALNLKNLGISEGKIINKDILERVYNSFLIREPRISWISVNFDGTVAKVEVKETEIVPERLDRDKNINVVAKCDGQIKRIDVFDGNKEATAGDVVTKGQLLISSFTETRNTGVFMKAARGNVWAATVHKYEIHIKKSSRVRAAVKDVTKKNSILVAGIRIPAYIVGSNSSEHCECEYEIERFCLFGKYPLPFETETYTVSEFDTSCVYEGFETAKVKADAELERRINAELNDVEVFEKNMVCDENDDEYVFSYELLCIENIAESVEYEFN